MFIMERHEKILKLLEEHESLSVKELSDELGYSPATIRSDLNDLNKQNLLIRTHGGAVVKEADSTIKQLKEDFGYRTQHNQIEKVAIAKKALTYIEDRMSIFLDASSSSFELAKLLSHSEMRLTILTNGLHSAQLLKDNSNVTTILIGGTVKGNSNATEGLMGAGILNNLNIDCAFLSAQAFDLQNGMTDFSLYEVELKKKVVEKVHTVYGLLDHSKFEQSSVASFASADQISVLITDHRLDRQTIEQYAKYGLNVVQTSVSSKNKQKS
ncbi:MAG: DeoR/GlpR family DNA-binding transcription regulator [Desemzia incerta]